MAPLSANASCDPWQPASRPCELGNYVRYSVNVSTAADVTAALTFAKKHKIRFVIRNTGHDFGGRSVGAGALSVWTHYLKDRKVLDWSDQHYTGKALKLGAGVQGFEALELARDAGLVVLTGECPSVGVVGGYLQGGGHSGLSTNFGLAADNTLSFDVVLPNGHLVTASRSENQDLYWALSGGGGGNYGVVMSATVKAFPDTIVSGAQFAVSAPTDGPDWISKAIDAFHTALPDIVDQGVMIIYFFSSGAFHAPAMTAYNKTREETEAILKPFVDSAISLGLSVKVDYTQFPSYHDHYNHYWGPFPAGNIPVGVNLFGGRLVPRRALPAFSTTARQLLDRDVLFIGVGLNVSRFGGRDASDNAVLPAWRDTVVSAVPTFDYDFTVPLEEMRARQDRITREIQPLVDAAVPGAGAYMNEADFQQVNFQEAFFGENYAELLRIKEKYDPEGLLYAVGAVGGEKWEVKQDGHLCNMS